MFVAKLPAVTAVALISASALAMPAGALDYPLTATVKCSYARAEMVRIGALVNGKMIELTTVRSVLPMALGDYKMRLVRDKQEKPYEVDQNYELLMSDGSKRTFYVSGVGDGVCATAASS